MRKKSTSITIITLSMAAVTMFGLTLPSQSSGQSPAVNTTLTGTISDSMCGAKHMQKNKTPAECTRECVKDGSDYALVVGEKVYALKGNRTDIDKLAGQRATVKGSLDGDTVTVRSVAAAK
jgi:hypothetical protein